MKLEYWVSLSYERISYNIRAKTRAEVVAELRNYGCDAKGKDADGDRRFTPPRKVAVNYRDAWHLFSQGVDAGIHGLITEGWAQ